MEAAAPVSTTRGPATSPSAKPRGAGVVGAVVIVQHFVVSLIGLFTRFCWVYRWVFNEVCFVMVFVCRPVYRTFVMVCGAVGTLHRSRVVWRRGAVDIRRGVFSTVCRYVGWGRNSF